MAGRARLGEDSVEKDIQQEGEWINATLTATLDSYATRLRVTAGSKRLSTPEVEGKRKEYGKIGRLYQQGRTNEFTLRTVRNSYYYYII